MKLPQLSARAALKGKRVFVRVDWNVPTGSLHGEDSLKVERSVSTIKSLVSRGAIVIVAFHYGRPKKRDLKFSTKQLSALIATRFDLSIDFLPQAVDTREGLLQARERIGEAKPGTIFVLENVRFYSGEETNAPALGKAFASLADIFVNDAFASCHRSHASVVGVAKYLPHYAGASLIQEVDALQRLVLKPKRPLIAIVGGAKISTKINVLRALLGVADRICIGGAMANTLLAAQGKQVGKSLVDKEGLGVAKKLLSEKKILLPVDVVAGNKIQLGAKVRACVPDEVKRTEAIGDIGPMTMRAWAGLIKDAQTIVWNGPLGVAEIPAFSHGSLVIARAIAARSKGSAFGVVGGGDTLPIAFASGMSEWFDHLSTGGGAMLEFLAKKGALPGLVALLKR